MAASCIIEQIKHIPVLFLSFKETLNHEHQSIWETHCESTKKLFGKLFFILQTAFTLTHDPQPYPKADSGGVLKQRRIKNSWS